MSGSCACACLALWMALLCAVPVQAQAPTAAEMYVASPLSLTGGRASSLGGSLVSRADDNSTAWWNPAGTGGLERMTAVGVNAGIVTPNSRQLLGIYQALTATDAADPSINDLETFVDFGRNMARDARGVIVPVTLGASASVFVNAGNVGLFAVSSGATEMAYDVTDQIRGGRREVHMESSFAALGVAEVGASYSTRVGEFDVGLAFKDIEGYYVGAASSMDVVDSEPGDPFDDGDTTVAENSPTVALEGRARAFGLDLGLLKRNGERTQLGLVVRNINSPMLRFTDSTGGVVQQLRLRPRVDIGVATKLDRHVSLNVDMHNLTFANSDGPSLHLGLEWRVSGSSGLRFGVNRGALSLGLGFRAGGLTIDGAVGAGESPFASVGAHLSF